MNPDLIFWYTGWIIWAGIAAVLFVAVALVSMAVAYRAYRANINWWWHYFVVARLRDVYKLAPDQMRDALWEDGKNWGEVQDFMTSARKICDAIDRAKKPYSYSGTGCRWVCEGDKWYALCGSTWSATAMTPFKDDLMHCPCCAREIVQTSRMDP